MTSATPAPTISRRCVLLFRRPSNGEFPLHETEEPAYFAALSAGALLAATASPAPAANVQVTLQTQFSGTGYDVIFASPVTSATDLVSISAGTVNTGEFGSITISAITTADGLIQLYSTPGSFGSPHFTDFPLSQYTNNTFPDFAVPTNIKGLRVTSGGATPLQHATLLLPVGTILTFATVPEPAAALLLVAGLWLLAFLRHGYRQRSAASR